MQYFACFTEIASKLERRKKGDSGVHKRRTSESSKDTVRWVLSTHSSSIPFIIRLNTEPTHQGDRQADHLHRRLISPMDLPSAHTKSPGKTATGSSHKHSTIHTSCIHHSRKFSPSIHGNHDITGNSVKVVVPKIKHPIPSPSTPVFAPYILPPPSGRMFPKSIFSESLQ